MGPIACMRHAITRWTLIDICIRRGLFLTAHTSHRFLVVSTMATKSQQPKGRDGVLSSLGMAIDGLNFVKEVSSITPAKTVYSSVVVLLTMIRVDFRLFCDEMLRVHTWLGVDG